MQLRKEAWKKIQVVAVVEVVVVVVIVIEEKFYCA